MALLSVSSRPGYISEKSSTWSRAISDLLQKDKIVSSLDQHKYRDLGGNWLWLLLVNPLLAVGAGSGRVKRTALESRKFTTGFLLLLKGIWVRVVNNPLVTKQFSPPPPSETIVISLQS